MLSYKQAQIQNLLKMDLLREILNGEVFNIGQDSQVINYQYIHFLIASLSCSLVASLFLFLPNIFLNRTEDSYQNTYLPYGNSLEGLDLGFEFD